MAMPGMEPYAWQVVLAVSRPDDDPGQRDGPVAGRSPPAAGLFVDRACRLHAHRAGRGLATGNAPGAWNGVAALGFYLVVYAAATIGAFAVLEHLGRPDRRLDGVDELAGLGRTRPLAAAVLAVCHVQPGGRAAAGRLLGEAAGCSAAP